MSTSAFGAGASVPAVHCARHRGRGIVKRQPVEEAERVSVSPRSQFRPHTPPEMVSGPRGASGDHTPRSTSQQSSSFASLSLTRSLLWLTSQVVVPGFAPLRVTLRSTDGLITASPLVSLLPFVFLPWCVESFALSCSESVSSPASERAGAFLSRRESSGTALKCHGPAFWFWPHLQLVGELGAGPCSLLGLHFLPQ